MFVSVVFVIPFSFVKAFQPKVRIQMNVLKTVSFLNLTLTRTGWPEQSQKQDNEQAEVEQLDCHLDVA